jgi:tRNA(Arg) A34 adenosine deaminase TadA
MISKDKQEELMHEAIAEAQLAKSEKNHPFGALLIDDAGNIIARAHNSQHTIDRTCHAEIMLVKAASKMFSAYQLSDYSVICTSEPCSMCMSLLVKTHAKTLYFGTPPDKKNDPYITAEEVNKKAVHKIKIFGGILEDQCRELFRDI